MSNQPRVAKVLAALLVSMTIGAVVLMSLGNAPPAAGPWSLCTYRSLTPVQKYVSSRAAQSPSRWNCIEIYYSGTARGNLKELLAGSGAAKPEDLDCHYVVCNGSGGEDGDIQPTEKWQRQWPVVPSRTWYGTRQTIRICVVADGEQSRPTECQVKRTEELIGELRKGFQIPADSIYQPGDWP